MRVNKDVQIQKGPIVINLTCFGAFHLSAVCCAPQSAAAEITDSSNFFII